MATLDDAIDPISKKPVKQIHGYFLDYDGKTEISSIRHNLGKLVSRGQMVTSNGRIEEAGKKGIVVRIHIPFENVRTNDILEVHFEGHFSASMMKMKDLELPEN